MHSSALLAESGMYCSSVPSSDSLESDAVLELNFIFNAFIILVGPSSI